MGQYFYSTRTNDPYLSRFAQADTIVPGGVQGYDRYAYVLNNPIRFTDPTGHYEDEGCGTGGSGGGTGCNLPPPLLGGGSGDSEKEGAFSWDDFPKDPTINWDPSGQVDFISASSGISVPGAMVLGCGLLSELIPACIPVAIFGLELISTPANLFSIGFGVTLDSYGKVYGAPQLSIGKTVPGVPIAYEIVGYKIDSSSTYATEQENMDFIKGSSYAWNFIGIPGLSGARIPPTGKLTSVNSGETATSGTYIGSSIIEGVGGWTFRFPFDLWSSDIPWQP